MVQNNSSIKESIQEYYGKILNHSKDLKTNACCDPTNSLPSYVKNILSLIHDEVLTKYYGCGLILPECLENTNILDLGSGAGRDCFLLSKLVGENGFITGVDLTDEQLAVAIKHIDYHAQVFKYKKSNVEFIKGDIDKLNELSINRKYDVIISNCVVNLLEDKYSLLKNVFSLLKEGGEIYFSDIYSSRRLPDTFKKDQLLYNECLGGALYWNDFLDIAKNVGFKDPRLVESRTIDISDIKSNSNNSFLNNDKVEFYSMTYRLFKIKDLESNCEDYGQAVVYKGTIPHYPSLFKLDHNHFIEKGKVFSVCGNTYRILNETRFKSHFEFLGNFKTHYGFFKNCGSEVSFNRTNNLNQDFSLNSCC